MATGLMIPLLFPSCLRLSTDLFTFFIVYEKPSFEKETNEIILETVRAMTLKLITKAVASGFGQF